MSFTPDINAASSAESAEGVIFALMLMQCQGHQSDLWDESSDRAHDRTNASVYLQIDAVLQSTEELITDRDDPKPVSRNRQISYESCSLISSNELASA